MSNLNLPSPSSCDLYDAGHTVFWLKSIKTIQYPREVCEVRNRDQESIILKLGSGEVLMFNHEAPRIAAALNSGEIQSAEYCSGTGYLYLFHDDSKALVFSLSEVPLGNCEVDQGILRF